MKKLQNNLEFLNLLKPREKFDVYYQNIAIVGIVFLVLLIRQKNMILVPTLHLVIGGILSSLIITFLFYKFYKKHLNIIWAVFHNLSIGIIIVYFLVNCNDWFSSSKIISKQYEIKRTYMVDNHQKYDRGLETLVVIEIEGKDKKIRIPSFYNKQVLHSKNIEIGIRQGIFGYSMIKYFKIISAY